MNKRGQFFLAAALIIVSILLGIGGIYSSISAPKEDTTVNQLAREIKYESVQTLNYATVQGLNYANTILIIKSLIGNYSKLNPEVEIFFWIKLKNESNSFSAYYKKGTEEDNPFGVTEEPISKRVVILDPPRDIYYNLSVMDKINNLYILVGKDYANGRTFEIQ